MTDTSELVKQLLRESRHHTDVKAEAAKAIKRLERELEITKASLTDAEKAEHKLADARAEIERMDRVFERIAMDEESTGND